MNSDDFLRTVRETSMPTAWWMGQMGLFLKLGETLISIDYYADPSPRRLTPVPVPAEEVRGVSLFLGSHIHDDHIDLPSWKIYLNTCPDALFVVPRAVVPSLLSQGFPERRLIGMNHGETWTDDHGVTIRSVAASHEFLDRDPVTGLYPYLQYVIEGDGVRIYHAGDTVRYESMLPALQALGPFDLALVPINGRDARRYLADCIGNMTFQEAADLVGELRPRLAVPGHWDMFPGNTADPQDFKSYLSAKYGSLVPCLIPEIMQPLPLGI